MRALNTLVSVGLLEIEEKVALPEPEPPLMPEPRKPAPVEPSTPEPAAAMPQAAPAPSKPGPVPDVHRARLAAPPSPDPSARAPSPESNDVEKLFDAYENKRALETGGHTPPSPDPLPPESPASPPTAPDPPETHEPYVHEPPLPTMAEPRSPLAFEPEPEAVYEAAPPPVEIDETPLPTTSLPPPRRIREPGTPKAPLSERLGALLPMGKGRVIAASVALGLAAIVVTWLVSGADRGSEPEPVVSASTKEPPPAPAWTAEAPEATPEFLEADFFYRANVAVGEEDYEQAKIELEALLELKPDFTAAQSLLDKVNLELEPPEPEATPKPKPRPRPKQEPKQETPTSKPSPPPPVEPESPDPALLFAEAQMALEQGDIEAAEAKLEELRAVDGSHAQADRLVQELAHARWMDKLPLSYSGKHDHKLGSCEGIVTLNADGIGFTSDAHSWSWPFAQLTRSERRDSKRLRIETTRKKKFNFELHDPIQLVDWSKFLNLANSRVAQR